ncbi:MAG: ATP-binding protein [Ancrocorticia sp.]|jgi:hypothetical protein
MFTPIHQSLGLEPGELSIELIERAVEGKVQETASLDWKGELYDSRKPGWDDEAAKDIAAMANSGGGWLVFGVAEDKETGAASAFKPISWNANEHQRILRIAYSRIGPPVLGLEFFTFPKDDGQVVMMRVPDSHEAPHFARKGNDAFVAPRRNGPHTAFMSEREIERGFRERFQQRDDDERQLQLLYEQTGKVLDPTEGVCIVLAAIPREPVTSRPLIEEADAMRFVSLSPFPELVYGNRRALIRWESGQVRKGLRQWVIRNYDGENWAYRKFLSEDGTVAGGYRLGAVVDGDSAAYYFPVDEPNHCMAPHIESAIIDFLSLLRAYATELQTSGGYTIRAGLIGNPDEPIYIRTTQGSGAHFD